MRSREVAGRFGEMPKVLAPAKERPIPAQFLHRMRFSFGRSLLDVQVQGGQTLQGAGTLDAAWGNRIFFDRRPHPESAIVTRLDKARNAEDLRRLAEMIEARGAQVLSCAVGYLLTDKVTLATCLFSNALW